MEGLKTISSERKLSLLAENSEHDTDKQDQVVDGIEQSERNSEEDNSN